MIQTTELNGLVREEAANLKKFATRKELDKLDFERLIPNNEKKCIYGQMTGNCKGIKAFNLINNCCKKKVFTDCNEILSTRNIKLFKGVNWQDRICNFYSPIEVFILQGENKFTNNKNLISYLKGEADTLIIE